MHRSGYKLLSLSLPSIPTAILAIWSLGFLAPEASGQSSLYWTDTERGAIYRMDTASGTSETLLTASMLFPGDVEIDEEGGKVYWIEGWSYATPRKNFIRRSNLDGTQIEDLSESDRISSLELDVNAGKMYWTGREEFGGPSGIYRANLDGTNREFLYETEWSVKLALDAQAQKMYWGKAGKIQRANLDGTGAENVITGHFFPVGLALNLTAGTIYWTNINSQSHTIHRANMDGSDQSTVIDLSLGLTPTDLKVDPVEGKVYWTAYQTAAPAGRIQRASLDGSGLEDLVTEDQYEPAGLAFTGNRMYWTDRILGRLQRASRSGRNVEDLITSSVGDPQQIAVDEKGGKIYWVESHLIRRADLDGSNQEILHAVMYWGFVARGLALDPDHGKMYWTTWDGWLPRGTSGPFRANLDGSNHEDLSWGAAMGLAVDSDNEKIYWSGGPRLQSVYRSSFDGAEVEHVFNGERVRDIVLDLSEGKYYYIQGYNGGIHRANIDGTGSAEALIAMNAIRSLTLDLDAHKMYWVDRRTILRANLDGSEIETVADFEAATIGDITVSSDGLSIAVEPGLETPYTHQLAAAYPNPFSTQANFTLTVKRTQHVRLDVMDMLGRIVSVLYEGPLSAYEAHRFTIKGADFPGGMYIYRATGEDFQQTGKVVLVR